MVTKHEMDDLLERYRRWLDQPMESESETTPSPKALRVEIGIVVVLVALVSVGTLVYLA